MLQTFYESQDFYLLKELEKMGPKKGVISQSVKDVIQTLVDDDLVLKDKIGTSRENNKRGCEQSDEREAALEELKANELEHKKLKDELASYAENDSAALEAMKNAIGVAHSAANRLTDNILTLQQWCSTTFPQAKEQLEHLYKEAGVT